MKKIEVGIIGAGNIITSTHIPLLSCLKDIRIKYVADIKTPSIRYPKETQRITIGKDLSTLPECDLALLAIPVGAREPYIKEFGKRNTPVFSEKPFALDTEKHKRFLQHSARITCNYMRTCYSAVQQLKEIASSQLFGELQEVRITEGSITGKTSREKETYQANTKLSGGGILMEMGCHSISELTEVLSDYTFKVQKADVLYQGDLDIETTAIISATKKDKKVKVTYQISRIRDLPNTARYIFDAAELSHNHLDPQSQIYITSKNTRPITLTPNTQWATTLYQAFYLKWRRFINQLQHHLPIDTTKETSLPTTEIISEIYRRTR